MKVLLRMNNIELPTTIYISNIDESKNFGTWHVEKPEQNASKFKLDKKPHSKWEEMGFENKETSREYFQNMMIQDYRRVVYKLIGYLQDMENEYEKDDTCDYVKINRLIEESSTYTAAIRVKL